MSFSGLVWAVYSVIRKEKLKKGIKEILLAARSAVVDPRSFGSLAVASESEWAKHLKHPKMISEILEEMQKQGIAQTMPGGKWGVRPASDPVPKRPT